MVEKENLNFFLFIFRTFNRHLTKYYLKKKKHCLREAEVFTNHQSLTLVPRDQLVFSITKDLQRLTAPNDKMAALKTSWEEQVLNKRATDSSIISSTICLAFAICE